MIYFFVGLIVGIIVGMYLMGFAMIISEEMWCQNMQEEIRK